MVDAWGRDEQDEDPLAKLERLVNARTDRMTGRTATTPTASSAAPAAAARAGSLRGAIDDLYDAPMERAPLPVPPARPVAPAMPGSTHGSMPDVGHAPEADAFDAIADLDRELERVLASTARPSADADLPPVDLPPVDLPPIDPPLDMPLDMPSPDTARLPAELPVELPVGLPPSLMALRSGAGAPPPDLAPTLEDTDPLPRFLRHAAEGAEAPPALDDAARDDPDAGFDANLDADFDADLSDALDGAVSDALAAATAAIAVTATQRPSADRPAAIAPLAVPKAPAYEASAFDTADASANLSAPAATSAPIEFGDDFERDLVDELLQIEPPIGTATGAATGGAEADPLVAPLAATAAFGDDAVPAPANDNASRRRGMLVAAMLAGVAVTGGLAAISLGGESAPTEVALIRADPAPLKVRPAEPGGRTVPNQSNAVYERVATVKTAKAKAPAKPTPLIVDKTEDVSALREPVLPAEASPPRAPESVARLDAVDVSPREVYAPRAVRTIRVGPDGTLVTPGGASGEATPNTVAPSLAATAVDGPVDAADGPVASSAADPVVAALEGTPAPGTPLPRFRPVDPATATLATTTLAAAAPVTATPVTATPVTATPTGPAGAPVSVVDAATADAVAPATVPGGYVVQIASVPSADAARRTYGQLAGRFGSIIGGRGVDYQVAQIPGKGTFHRVRIPAASKADANATCASLKSAGGSCFVTR